MILHTESKCKRNFRNYALDKAKEENAENRRDAN
jgi:hypothetical protein